MGLLPEPSAKQTVHTQTHTHTHTITKPNPFLTFRIGYFRASLFNANASASCFVCVCVRSLCRPHAHGLACAAHVFFTRVENIIISLVYKACGGSAADSVICWHSHRQGDLLFSLCARAHVHITLPQQRWQFADAALLHNIHINAKHPPHSHVVLSSFTYYTPHHLTYTHDAQPPNGVCAIFMCKLHRRA